jgi:SAM-dependent methyltransferase
VAADAANVYRQYLDDEWARFAREAERAGASLAATEGIRVRRVLDVGCGAGQELTPFARGGAFGVGVYLNPASAPHGRRLYARHLPAADVAFITSAAEHLPFRDGAFDAAICRVALPYTDNARALAEIGRVLRPGGVLLLKIHHHRFYVAEALAGLRKRRILPAVHAARVIAAGCWYQITGRQPRGRLFSGETALSESLLRRELSRAGLEIVRRLPDWNAETPAYVIHRC